MMSDIFPTGNYEQDSRIVITLDAGGSSFRFSALRGGRLLFPPISCPTPGDDLAVCLDNIEQGFATVIEKLPGPAVALSFAFPGPANYPQGIIGDLPNLPAFRNGVALGPALEERFGLPVFINNDAGLFTLGEALGGQLPWMNDQLAAAGSGRRYQNLFGLTLGTGCGGGWVTGGQLVMGDNSMASGHWILRPGSGFLSSCVDELLSIRGLRRAYAEYARIPLNEAPEPKEMAEIAQSRLSGDMAAAVRAFARFGEALGDLLVTIGAITDCPIVLGGGLSGASPLFLPHALAVVRQKSVGPDGVERPRLIQQLFDLENPASLNLFLQDQSRQLPIRGSERTVAFDPQPRLAIGLSKLGTTAAIGLGAYAFALRRLDR